MLNKIHWIVHYSTGTFKHDVTSYMIWELRVSVNDIEKHENKTIMIIIIIAIHFKDSTFNCTFIYKLFIIIIK